MIRSRLKNCFNETRFDKNQSLQKARKELLHEIVKKKTKKDCFSKVNPKLVLDNKNTSQTKETFLQTYDFKKDGIVFYNRKISAGLLMHIL